MKMLLNPNICLISISLLVKFLDGSIFEHSPLMEQQQFLCGEGMENRDGAATNTQNEQFA